ncbi:kinase-like domain-containing protein, partial [Mycena leptocephala]
IKREASIWAPLEHKNLVPFFGVCDDITPYPVLISPLYKLGDVGGFLRRTRLLTDPIFFVIETNWRTKQVLGVASGLEYLHDHGIVHGDLKPSNVLVDEQFVPHICDFGISRYSIVLASRQQPWNVYLHGSRAFPRSGQRRAGRNSAEHHETI